MDSPSLETTIPIVIMHTYAYSDRSCLMLMHKVST